MEALTERLLAARTGPVRRERRILFDGRPAEIHPYDVTVERDGAAEAWDCKWGARGIKADVIHQLDDARRGAADEEAALLVGLVVFDARRSCEVRLVRERGPVALDGLKLITLEGLDRLAGGSPRERCAPTPPRRGVTVPYRVRFDECGPDGLVRTSALLRYAQDVAWIHSERLGFDRAWYAERGLAWVVRAAELAILAPVPLGSSSTLSTARHRLPQGLGPPADRGPPGGRTLALWGHTDWVMTDSRGMPGRVPPEFPARSRCPRPVRAGSRPAAAAPDAPSATGRASGRRTWTRWATSTTPRTSTTSRRRSAAPATPHGRRSPRRRAGSASSTSSRPAPGAGLVGEAWPEPPRADSWAWRLTDDDGRELARARVLLRGDLTAGCLPACGGPAGTSGP